MGRICDAGHAFCGRYTGDLMTTQLLNETTNEANARFATLIDESYSNVYKMAYRLSGNRQDAEDVTQEACYRALRGIDTFEGDRPFANWMYRIVTRLYLDKLRTRRRRVSEISLDAPSLTYGDSAMSFDPQDPGPSPEQQVLSGVLSQELIDAMSYLTPEQCALVKLLDVDGISSATVAEQLELPCGTIRSRLHRAHRQLQKRLVSGSGGRRPSSQPPSRSPANVRTPSLRSSTDWSDWTQSSMAYVASLCA
jgi:RNA polymerase sigma-70 factor (ECF subfamily)